MINAQFHFKRRIGDLIGPIFLEGISEKVDAFEFEVSGGHTGRGCDAPI
jgi:hypothetical protein